MNNFFEIAGYLANPARQVLIEVEVPAGQISSFEGQYKVDTKGHSLPTPGQGPYYLQENKWGVERRLYYVDNGNAPVDLVAEVYNNTRPGYITIFNRRCDQGRELINPLFQHGFVLGSPQDEARRRATIPASEIADFNRGYSR
ncbi:hypothetical protein [Hymenobacter aerophilus]|uniref:hypothetical protein n=1 Tax=Hymenobacter aerophilus TaxID=119644 RepID=UPI0012F71091|nr:hypothetical protein [Hymenobacter aerophilus]